MLSLSAGGGGRHRVLQTDLHQLQRHQTGSTEGDAAPHPLWSEHTDELQLINNKKFIDLIDVLEELKFRCSFLSS